MTITFNMVRSILHSKPFHHIHTLLIVVVFASGILESVLVCPHGFALMRDYVRHHSFVLMRDYVRHRRKTLLVLHILFLKTFLTFYNTEFILF